MWYGNKQTTEHFVAELNRLKTEGDARQERIAVLNQRLAEVQDV